MSRILNIDPNAPATKGDLLEMQRQLEQILEQRLEAIAQPVSRIPVKEYYTIKEFAHITGQGRAAVQKLCYSGEIKASQLKRGGTWSIHASELDRMKKEAMENHFAQSKETTRRNKAIMKKINEGKL